MPPQDGAGSDDEPQPGEALGRQCPGQQRQPRPIRPRQPRVSPRLLAQGDSQLMAQDQDLGVLPPRLPPAQAQQRHGAGDDEEDQFQAHQPKTIARKAMYRPPRRPPGARPERMSLPANLPRWQWFSALTRRGGRARVPRLEAQVRCSVRVLARHKARRHHPPREASGNLETRAQWAAESSRV
jgi:hypothetical protein